MAEENEGKKKDDKKEKKESPAAISIFAGEMTADRRIVVNVFVSQGGKAMIGKRVDVYFGDAFTPVFGPPMITDAMGKVGTVINVPAGIKGPQKIYAHTEGVAYPSAITVDIPEEKKDDVVELDIEPTGLWYDDREYSHVLWTPRAFDKAGKAVKAKLHIVGARPFRIIGLDPPVLVEKKIFDIKISEKAETYEVVVTTPGLLEVDVFVEGVDTEDELMLEGAREINHTSPQGGGFLKHLKWGLGIGGHRNE